MSTLLSNDQCQQVQQDIKSCYPATKLIGHIQRKLNGHEGQDVFADRWPDWTALLVKISQDPSVANNLPGYLHNVVHVYSKEGSSHVAVKELMENVSLKWTKRMVFAGCNKHLIPPIQEICKCRGVTLACNTDDVLADLLITSPESVNQINIPDIPPDLTVDTLSCEDAVVLDDLWKYGQGEGSLEYTKFLIETSPSVCLRDQNEQLVAFEITQGDGSMGMLYVKENYRRKDLGKFIVISLAKKLFSLGLSAHCFVEKENKHSINLHKQCGFQIIENCEVFWATYIPTTDCKKKSNKCCV